MKLKDIHSVKRREIKRRFVLPSNEDEVEVDENFRPYETISGAKVFCSLKKTALIDGGFHTHGARNN
ncbi:MAG: hypothetical protein KDH96_06945 [Candidatus Riesia sp.]|nr:hypothetical protein [Candidatus Riesia sp.]